MEVNSNNTSARSRRHKNTSTEETLTLRDILDTFVDNWYWFLISAILCVAASRLYLATKSNIYQRQAVMLVKDDNGQGGSSSSRRSNISTDALMQLNGVLAGASVKNEVYILHSFQLAQEVAKNLQLDVMYSIRSGLRNISLYNDRPFSVDFITDFTVPASFKFTVDNSRGGTISDVKFGIPMKKSGFTTKVEWGIDFDGNIDGVLETRLEKECALLDNDGCVLLQGPLEEVLTDNGMDDAVDAFGVALIGEEVAGDEGFVESAGCVGFSADEFAQLLTDDGAFGHEAFGFVVALIDGYASLLEQLADIGLAAADASCDADACH